jgi:hypothetical protein
VIGPGQIGLPTPAGDERVTVVDNTKPLARTAHPPLRRVACDKCDGELGVGKSDVRVRAAGSEPIEATLCTTCRAQWEQVALRVLGDELLNFLS